VLSGLVEVLVAGPARTGAGLVQTAPGSGLHLAILAAAAAAAAATAWLPARRARDVGPGDRPAAGSGTGAQRSGVAGRRGRDAAAAAPSSGRSPGQLLGSLLGQRRGAAPTAAAGAGAAAVGAVLVLLAAVAVATLADLSGRGPGSVAGSPVVWAAGVAATLSAHGILGVVPPTGLASVFAVRARRRTSRARAAAGRRRSVAQGVQVLASELRAGTPALEALRSASTVSPELVPVAGAGLLGGDVADGLRRAGERPGSSGLRYVAAAWTVSAEMGSALADTMDQLVDLLRSEDLARDETASTLAAPRATARLLCVLPLGGLAMGASLGAHPWQTLTDTSWGPALTVLSVLLAGAGLEWVELLAARAEDPGGRTVPEGRRRRPGREKRHLLRPSGTPGAASKRVSGRSPRGVGST